MNYTHEERTQNYPYLTTDKEKQARDRKLAKDLFEHYDFSLRVSPEEKARVLENLNLHVGRWPNIPNMNGVEFSAAGEAIQLGGGKINHYPLIDKLSSGGLADIILQPLTAQVKDTSFKGINMRRKLRSDRINEWAKTKYIDPAMRRATNIVNKELGITDPAELTPEEQEQYQQAVDQEMRGSLTDSLVEELERTKTPGETVFQAFLGDYIKRTGVKYKFDTGGEFALTCAKEYYLVRPGLREPIMEALAVDEVAWVGSENVEFCEDGVAAKVGRFITPEDMISRHGYMLQKRDIDKLLKGFAPSDSSPGSGSEYRRGIESEALEMILYNPEMHRNFNVKTEEGQDMLKYVYSQIPTYGNKGAMINETYISFKWTRRASRVLRRNPETGKESILFRGEHYMKNPLKGDITVERTMIPQVWHGLTLGIGENKVFVFIEPVPDQYQDVDDPFNVKLTIFGGEHGGPMRKVAPASHVDRAKPWNWRYNVLMKRLDIHEATDFGRVLIGTAQMKPVGWSYQEFFQSMLFGKFGMIRSTTEGLAPQDLQVLRQVDLGAAGDIASILDRLSYTEGRLTAAFYQNETSVGTISPYATNRNSDLAVQGAQKPMVKFHERRRVIKENVLNAILRSFITTYRDNEKAKARLLDEYGIAYFDTMLEDLDSFYTVKVFEDFEETDKLRRMRDLALTIMQNGGTTRQLAAIIDADSMSEIKDILERYDREMAIRAKEDRESQERIAAEMNKARAEETQAERALKEQLAYLADDGKRYQADQASRMLENANDVNRNQLNDNLERDLIKIGLEEQKLAEMTRLKDKELTLRFGAGAGK